MPKGHTKYTKYETAVLKADRDIQKAMRRLAAAAEELRQRPEPVVAATETKTKTSSPRKPAKAKQLKLPGTVKRKAAKRR